MRQALAISGGPDAVAVLSLHHRVATSIEKLRNRLHTEVPQLAQDVSTWMDAIAPGGQAANYLSDPLMFPVVQLPAWLLQTVTGSADVGFLSDITYSTVSGYYLVRLMDNIQDGHATVEGKLLPAAGFLDQEFRSVYQKYFSSQHPFWAIFERFWQATNASVEKEALLREMGLEDFREIAADKYAAAKIPMAAAAFHSGHAASLPPWFEFCDELARATQLLDDLLDWQDDLRAERCTYYLSHILGCKAKHESPESYVLREGFFWGLQQLRAQTIRVGDLALELNCGDLIHYLDQRGETVSSQMILIQQGLKSLQQLRQILGGSTETAATNNTMI